MTEDGGGTFGGHMGAWLGWETGCARPEAGRGHGRDRGYGAGLAAWRRTHAARRLEVCERLIPRRAYRGDDSVEHHRGEPGQVGGALLELGLAKGAQALPPLGRQVGQVLVMQVGQG